VNVLTPPQPWPDSAQKVKRRGLSPVFSMSASTKRKRERSRDFSGKAKITPLSKAGTAPLISKVPSVTATVTPRAVSWVESNDRPKVNSSAACAATVAATKAPTQSSERID